MATKKFLELKEYTDAELQSEIEETKTQYQRLKFDHAIKGLENPLLLREIRRDVARLNTEARRRQLEHMPEEEAAGRSKIRIRRRLKK